MTDDRDHLSDAQLRFYLERREQIDEWALLNQRESAAGSQFMRSLPPDVQGLASEIDPKIITDLFQLESSDVIGLWKSPWGVKFDQNESSGLPRVMVAIGWWRRTMRFEGKQVPWIGLVVPNYCDDLRAMIGQHVYESGAKQGTFGSGYPLGSTPWVCYTNVPCSHDRYWDDLEPYRKRLLELTQLAWRQLSGPVDEALKEFSAMSPQVDGGVAQALVPPPFSIDPAVEPEETPTL